MYQKVLTKPRKWDETSLALATREELVADLLLRKAKLQFRKPSRLPWEIRAQKKEIYWIQVVNQELEQRSQCVIEN